MPLVQYIPTVYVNDSVPAINASNLNKTENGLKDVTDAVIDLRDNPVVASETVFGVARIWTTTDGGDVTGHISTI